MSYLVLARKWRPKTFSEMIGQEHVTRTLINALTSGKTAHAYLFNGPRGVGKTTAARVLAKAVNCEQGMGPEPCNSCSSCVSIDSGNSLDVVEMDGASNRGIDEIRALKEHVGYAPVSSRMKVYIIDEVHMLTEQAFNALLKTLEEPPPHIIFILATTEAHKMPATILSRCQRFDFRTIPDAAVIQRLKFLAHEESIEAEDAALALMARRAGGCLRDAESLLDQLASAYDERIDEQMVRDLLGLIPTETLVDFIERVAAGDISAVARQLDIMVSEGMEPERVAADLMDLLLRLVRNNVVGAEGPSAEAEMIRNSPVLTQLDTTDLLRYLNVLQDAESLARHSSTPRPVLESAFFRCAMMDKTVKIEALLNDMNMADDNTDVSPQRPEKIERPKSTEVALNKEDESGHNKRDSEVHDSGGEILTSALRFVGGSVRSFVNRATARWADEGQLILEYGAADQFAFSSIQREEPRMQLMQALKRVSGKTIKIDVEMLGVPKQQPKREQPQSDPLVKRILEQFNGIVIETRSREEIST